MPSDVIELLEREDNASQTVEKALRSYYGMMDRTFADQFEDLESEIRAHRAEGKLTPIKAFNFKKRLFALGDPPEGLRESRSLLLGNLKLVIGGEKKWKSIIDDKVSWDPLDLRKVREDEAKS